MMSMLGLRCSGGWLHSPAQPIQTGCPCWIRWMRLSLNIPTISVREALVTVLGDAGESNRGRVLLDDWPQSARDARYWRLRGRWELEYDHLADQAVKSFHIALAELPHDWRSWYRLARASRILGRDKDANQAAEFVSRIREVLDPLALGPQLDTAFNHLENPASLHELANLSDRQACLALPMPGAPKLRS